MAPTAKKAADFKKELEVELGGLPRLVSEMVAYTDTLETLTAEEEPMPPGEVRTGKPRPDFNKKGAYFRKALNINDYASGKVKTILKELLDYIDLLEAKIA
ncbi:MAG: hypothetical protein R2828_05350 [Saprospiraceae bacterium]